MVERDEERILQLLASEASVEPPRALDRAIRARIRRPAIAGRPVRRQALAAGLAVAAFLALASSLGIAWAEYAGGEPGLLIATWIALVYAAFSGAATLPLLLSRRSPAAARNGV
jgi:hypothetical protein